MKLKEYLNQLHYAQIFAVDQQLITSIPVDAITNMKLKVIGDFDFYIKELSIRHSADYAKILHKISFIQTYSSFEKIDPIYEFLINN